jgi:hypothetical protein
MSGWATRFTGECVLGGGGLVVCLAGLDAMLLPLHRLWRCYGQACGYVLSSTMVCLL